MGSKSVSIESGAYTKLDTGSATALLVQNTSGYPVEIIFASSLPSRDTEGSFILQRGQGLPRDTQTNDMYAAIANRTVGTTGNTPTVTVGE